VIVVSVRYTKAAQGDSALLERLRRPMVLGVELARTIKARVALAARPATPMQPYAGEKPKRRYVVSDAYAAQVGVTETRWRSSAAFHAGAHVRPGSFRVSGGLWRGLQVRNVGADAVVLDFEGSSLGAKRQATKTAGGRTRSRPVLLRNQVKAGTVFRFSRVNVVQPTDAENEALGAAVAFWARTAIGRVLGAELGRFSSTGDPALLSRLMVQPVV
jgi:hypothetical protein